MSDTTMTQAAPTVRIRTALPSPVTVAKIVGAGAVGLVAWEVFAGHITPLVLGGPLQPTGLIRGLFANFVGVPISSTTASVLHYATALLFYPLGYVLMTQIAERAVPALRHLVWLAMLGFVAIMSVDFATMTVAQPLGAFLGLSLIGFAWIADRTSISRSFGNGLMLGFGTWILALGVFVSLAGMPFMLNWGGLTWMSLIGHSLYGLAVAFVFDRLARA
ncbi:MAG: hypothetical protein AAFX39_02840 [Pseudomonadota bacterium]